MAQATTGQQCSFPGPSLLGERAQSTGLAAQNMPHTHPGVRTSCHTPQASLQCTLPLHTRRAFWASSCLRVQSRPRPSVSD